MIRHLQLTAVLLSLSLAPGFALAQDQPAPPPPPTNPDGPPARDRDQDQPADQERPESRELERHNRELERTHQKLQRRVNDLRLLIQDPLGAPPRPEFPPESAWLGIQLTPVPAALASQLNLDDKGVMVGNIFKGSPAEKAGLDRYDVITAVDGKPVAGGIDAFSKFSEHIRGKHPGEPVELTVINHGKENTLRVELGTPPEDWSRVEPKYREDPDVALQREFGLRGKIFRPGPNGGWLMEDLDAFPLFRDQLERQLRGQHEPPPGEAAPQGKGERQARVAVAVRVDKNGNRLQVQRDENGRITVERYKDGEKGKETSATYDNLDQLREKDREAYDLLQSAAAPERPGPPSPPHTPPLPGRPGFAPGPFQGPGPQARPFEPNPGLRGPEEARREWQRRFFQGPLKEFKGPEAETPAPRSSFDVAPDGKITVHFREGESEMTRTLNSAEELRDKAPRLYKQYEKLQKQMEE